jgi:hypothetical protein
MIQAIRLFTAPHISWSRRPLHMSLPTLPGYKSIIVELFEEDFAINTCTSLTHKGRYFRPPSLQQHNTGVVRLAARTNKYSKSR